MTQTKRKLKEKPARPHWSRRFVLLFIRSQYSVLSMSIVA